MIGGEWGLLLMKCVRNAGEKKKNRYAHHSTLKPLGIEIEDVFQ
jgi:hypothetical protein